MDTSFSDTAKRDNEFGLCLLLSADKQLQVLDPKIPITFSVICDRLIF
jgi:hypothetical protein